MAFLGATFFTWAWWAPHLHAQVVSPPLNIAASDIGGTVTGQNGPEVGVWVIAETTDLPTRFRKIVVTDRERSVPAAGHA
jgi:hypothetical protein